MTCQLNVYEFVMHDSLGHVRVNIFNPLYENECMIYQHQNFYCCVTYY